MKKNMSNKQEGARFYAALSWLYNHGWMICPLPENVAEIIAQRLSKGLGGKSRRILRRQVITHLSEGVLQPDHELNAAILNWKIATGGVSC